MNNKKDKNQIRRHIPATTQNMEDVTKLICYTYMHNTDMHNNLILKKNTFKNLNLTTKLFNMKNF